LSVEIVVPLNKNDEIDSAARQNQELHNGPHENKLTAGAPGQAIDIPVANDFSRRTVCSATGSHHVSTNLSTHCPALI
jgi:hypothetical protein